MEGHSSKRQKVGNGMYDFNFPRQAKLTKFSFESAPKQENMKTHEKITKVDQEQASIDSLDEDQNGSLKDFVVSDGSSELDITSEVIDDFNLKEDFYPLKPVETESEAGK